MKPKNKSDRNGTPKENTRNLFNSFKPAKPYVNLKY